MKEKQKLEIKNYLQELDEENVRENILHNFSKTPKRISPRFFYDKKGSDLFEQITKLEEYYPSTVEKKMLSTLVNELDLQLQNISIIELGSGDSSKITLLFEQLSAESLKTIRYFPVDVSKTAIEKSSRKLWDKFPLKSIQGICADFTQQMDKISVDGKKLFCFFGSTLGNFTTKKAAQLMQNIAAQMNPGDYLLLGADIIKAQKIMEAAYNDAKNITAAFNKNILNVVNKNIGSDFNPDGFKHTAFYNADKERIEMHLEALYPMKVKVKDSDDLINIEKGERIHTENSHKFDKSKLSKLGKEANLKIKTLLMAKNKYFSMILYEKR